MSTVISRRVCSRAASRRPLSAARRFSRSCFSPVAPFSALLTASSRRRRAIAAISASAAAISSFPRVRQPRGKRRKDGLLPVLPRADDERETELLPVVAVERIEERDLPRGETVRGPRPACSRGTRGRAPPPAPVCPPGRGGRGSGRFVPLRGRLPRWPRAAPVQRIQRRRTAGEATRVPRSTGSLRKAARRPRGNPPGRGRSARPASAGCRSCAHRLGDDPRGAAPCPRSG